jgi:hypothetical protein
VSDPAFVIAAYAIVLGGLGIYALLLGRRTRTARRVAQLLEREHDRVEPAPSGGSAAALPSRSSETGP